MQTNLERINFPPWAKPLSKPARYKILYGGRGGGKSYIYADLLLLMAGSRELRILCAREIQVSIKDSVHRLLADRIQALGMQEYFEVQNDTIKASNGSQFIFKGLKHNISTVKSMAGINIVWVEEAQTVSEDSWSVLLPTIRDQGSEVWLTINPGKRTDATSQRFLLNQPPDTFIRKVNWDDNPHFPDTLDLERRNDKEQRPESYAHIWEGHFQSAGDMVVIPYAWIESAVGLADKLGIQPSGKRYAGLDVAGAELGGDANALALRHGISLEGLETWNGHDTSKTTQRAARSSATFGALECYFDSVGVGEGVNGEWAAMRRRGENPKGMQWHPWNGGAAVLEPDKPTDKGNPLSPKNKDQYQNLKAQGWFALRERFYNAHKAALGQEYDPEQIISINPELSSLNELMAELAQAEHKTSGTGKTMVDKQPDKAPSPNLADSVMMAFWPARGFVYNLHTLM